MNAIEQHRGVSIGEPLAAMQPIIGQLKDVAPHLQPQLWLWCRIEEPLEHTLDTISDLIAQGYQQVQFTEACLETQLYDIRRTVKPSPGPVVADDIVQRWYKPGDKPYVPVVLSFSVPNGPYVEGVRIPLLNPLPLPQHGEYALIEHEGYLKVYSINALPLEARQRWARLGDALRELASPLLWPASDERHRLAGKPIEYQRTINQITARIKLTAGQDRTEAQGIYTSLEIAKIHVDELRTALRKPEWQAQWQEIQRMSKELAGDYYEHHLKNMAEATTTNSAPAPDIQHEEITSPVSSAADTEDHPSVEVEQQKPAKKPARPRVRRTPVTQKEDLAMISATVNREIINALRDPQTYIAYQEQGIAEHRHNFNKEKGQIIIVIRPQDGEGFDTILAALNTLGDECIDTHIAVQAIALERNGVQHVRTPFRISPDDILEMRKKKKSHGSYTAGQRIEVIKHLKTLSQARIIAVMPGPGRRRKGKVEPTIIKAEGAIIDLLSFKIGEYHTITGEEIWEQRSISIGEWITMIPELNSSTARMLRQVLAYSAKNERYQKRLGIYLTLMFRINATKNAGKFPNDITMGALLEGAGIVAPREQGQFREAIEKALEHLKQDNVIGDYWRVVDDSPKGQEIQRDIHEHGRGWFNAYLKQKWNFSPPAALLTQYKKLLKEPTERKQA